MKYKLPHSAAIFFWPIFTRLGGGGAWPPWPHPWIRYWHISISTKSKLSTSWILPDVVSTVINPSSPPTHILQIMGGNPFCTAVGYHLYSTSIYTHRSPGWFQHVTRYSHQSTGNKWYAIHCRIYMAVHHFLTRTWVAKWKCAVIIISCDYNPFKNVLAGTFTYYGFFGQWHP